MLVVAVEVCVGGGRGGHAVEKVAIGQTQQAGRIAVDGRCVRWLGVVWTAVRVLR